MSNIRVSHKGNATTIKSQSRVRFQPRILSRATGAKAGSGAGGQRSDSLTVNEVNCRLEGTAVKSATVLLNCCGGVSVSIRV